MDYITFARSWWGSNERKPGCNLSSEGMSSVFGLPNHVGVSVPRSPHQRHIARFLKQSHTKPLFIRPSPGTICRWVLCFCWIRYDNSRELHWRARYPWCTALTPWPLILYLLYITAVGIHSVTFDLITVKQPQVPLMAYRTYIHARTWEHKAFLEWTRGKVITTTHNSYVC